MAGGKKKKKLVSNPARGFATTSIASKPKIEISDLELLPSKESPSKELITVASPKSVQSTPTETNLTAEEFERRLEESELQILVEKYAQRSKKDAQRQRVRLETDQRLLRGQAEVLHTKKWLPVEFVDEILQLIKTEGRFSGHGDISGSTKQVSQEMLTIRLLTLQQVLIESGFPEQKVSLALRHVLNISDRIVGGNKDMIWGLEESLDWLSRECSKEELPDYENCNRKAGGLPRGSLEKIQNSPDENGICTPHLEPDKRHVTLANAGGTGASISKETPAVKKGISIDYESDIDPDDLLSVYIDCKTVLFNLEISKCSKDRSLRLNKNRSPNPDKVTEIEDLESARVLRKLKKIEDDILFDKYVANKQWEKKRVELVKDAARLKSAKSSQDSGIHLQASPPPNISSDTVDQEAVKAKDLISETDSDEDSTLSNLFSSLPHNEIDPQTGNSTTMVNDSSSVRVVIRDFGIWSGMNPRRLLEETCRSRDSSVKLHFTLISVSSFSNRHSLQINWSKSQQMTCKPPNIIHCFSSPKSQNFTMHTISTPDSKQSEAYIATTALFCLFNLSKEDRVLHRLPPPWKNLCTEFADFNKELSDEADRSRIRIFRDMVREKRDQELQDGVLIQGAFKNRNVTRALENEESGADKISRLALASEAHKRIWLEKSSTYNYQIMLQSRMQLPMWSFKEKLLDTIEREQIVIICGETGCGKSTQVPSFILEHQLSQGKACKIYVTEPRRLSAISLARRVSEELGERKNDLGTNRSLVGYAIRLESNISKETCLVFATTGIVMRMLEGSNDLEDITHIILDEVHERTIDCDFLLIVLKQLITKRPDLKIILMSATVDAERFSKYLDGAPILNIPGRTFPVQVKYLEDAIELTGYSPDEGNQENFIDHYDEDLDNNESLRSVSSRADNIKLLRGYSNRTRNTISHIDEYRIDFDLIVQLLFTIATDCRFQSFSSAILVFLPGIGEIRHLNDMLSGHPMFSSNWFVYPLHSTIANEDQEAAFLVPEPGTRKIVIATNIAETGITIPDVTCVIDAGKHREMRFDERRQLSRLSETFISRANAKQRRGRAGRVQEGLCFHLFTKYRHDNLMPDQQTPEFLRLSLQDLAIRVKIFKLGGIEETLSKALDPPLPKNIRRAVDALVDVRALTPFEDLTPLGAQLARLPLDVFLGKLVILGLIFKCSDACITIAAILSSKSPFSAPFGARVQADMSRLAFKRGDSDLLTAYNAYLAWKRACIHGGVSEYQFCRKNYLSQQALANIEDLKGQLTISLVDSGFLPLTEAERTSLNRTRNSNRRRQFFDLPQRSNLNSENDIITASVIVWSFYPKLLVRDGKGFRNCANNHSISLHPSSVNKGCNEIKWLSYYHIMQAKQFYNAHETTVAEDFAIMLLCGDARSDMYSGVITIDGNRARFSISDWKTMLVIKTLRSRLREILMRSFKNPGKPLTIQQQKWMDIWQKIFLQRSYIDEKRDATRRV